MLNIENILTFLFPAAAVMATTATIFLWIRYQTPMAGWGGAFTLSTAFHLLCYSFVLGGTLPATVQFWFRLQVIAYSCVMFTWLYFVFILSSREHWINWRTVIISGIIPVLATGLVLVQPEFDPRWIAHDTNVVGSLIVLTSNIGWFAYPYLAYAMGIGLFSLGLLVKMVHSSTGHFRTLTLTLCIGLLFMILALTLDLLGVHPFSPVPNLQFGSILISIIAVAIVYVLGAGGILPIARATVFEYIQDAVVVLDRNDNLVDVNPAAAHILGLRQSSSLGRPISQAWPQGASLLEGLSDFSFFEGEHTFKANGIELTFDIKVSPVMETVSRERIGRVIVLRNVTGRERMEKAIQEHALELKRSNQLITALSMVASRLGSSGDSDEMLDNLGVELRKLGMDCAVVAMDSAGESASIKYVSLNAEHIQLFEKLTSISIKNHVVPRQYWPSDRILTEKVPVWHPDPQAYLRSLFPQVPDMIARKVSQSLGLQSSGQICILPLIIGERVIGAMLIWGEDLHPQDSPVLAVFASQVAGILQNASAYERETHRADELARSNAMILALSKVAAQVDSKSDFAALLNTVGTELKKIGADCAVGIYNKSLQSLAIQYVSVDKEAILGFEKLVGIPLTELTIPRHLWPSDRIALNKTPVWDPSLMRGPLRFLPMIPEKVYQKLAAMAGIRLDDPVCYLPLAHEEELVGVLAVWGSGLQHEDLPALSVFANQVANAINNRKLYELAQAEILERTRAQERLAHDALHDSLTDLPNRLLFVDRLDQRLERLKRHPQDLFAVLFIDLDRFKDVNDGLGHLVGDQLLIAVGQRLRHCVRPEDTVSRLGGDEFAILINEIHDVGDALRIAERIKLRLMSTSLLVDVKRATTVSIGIAMSNGKYARSFELLRDADTAMYRAKSQGGNQHQLFDEAMYSDVIRMLQMEGELKRAVDQQEWEVHYQPILSIASGRIAGVEALVRWAHPQRGIVSPLEFIKLAEDTGLIVQIGEHVLRTACAQVKNWRESGQSDLWVSVNLSGRQFNDPYLLRMIENILKYTGLPGDGLKLEVTESIAMKDLAHTTRVLNALSEMGIQVSLDDFGTGYSSLNYLNQFPIKVLKIDRSFIRDLEYNKNNKAITSAIISMGHNLSLELVAEGVETEDQLEYLRSQSCDKVQGFLFSRPRSSDQMTVWMQTHLAPSEI